VTSGTKAVSRQQERPALIEARLAMHGAQLSASTRPAEGSTNKNDRVGRPLVRYFEPQYPLSTEKIRNVGRHFEACRKSVHGGNRPILRGSAFAFAAVPFQSLDNRVA
jgi:hypothetical protein